jgi:hypothetical protein
MKTAFGIAFFPSAVMIVLCSTPSFAQEAGKPLSTDAAKKIVADLTQRDFATLLPADFVLLCQAYNQLGDDLRAIDAINRVPEAYLAKKGHLDLKATVLHNVNFRSQRESASLLRELAFYDRCIDRGYANRGLWYWRKASLLCRTSVETAVRPGVDTGEPRVLDREQYEYAFEILKRAFETEPNLLNLDSVSAEFLWSSSFPLLSTERRFKKLMGK